MQVQNHQANRETIRATARTRYNRGRDGWNGETTFDLPDSRQLTIRTYKSDPGRLRSGASVSTVNGDGTVTFIVSYGANGDYSRTVRRAPIHRVTEGVIRKFHEGSLLLLDAVLDDVQSHYDEHDRLREEKTARKVA